MLQRIEAVRGGGGGELRRQRLQLHHQAGVQGLQQGRLRLLLLQLQALHQLLQLRGKITGYYAPCCCCCWLGNRKAPSGFMSCNLKCLLLIIPGINLLALRTLQDLRHGCNRVRVVDLGGPIGQTWDYISWGSRGRRGPCANTHIR